MRPGLAAEDALAVVERAIAELITQGPEERALERAKARSELSLLSTAASIGGKAEQIGFDATVLGAPLSVDARIAAYRAVQRSDIRRVAAKYFDASRRSVVIVRPERLP